MQLRFAGASDLGRSRELNEDAFQIIESRRVAVVADGMGGHAHGAVASALVVGAFAEFFEAADTDFGAGAAAPQRGAAGEHLRAAVAYANDLVWRTAQRRDDATGMGSTVVAAYFLHETVAIAHVGDSRCYRVRGGKLHQLTRDHTLVEEFRAEAEANVAERMAPALLRRYEHILDRAIGRGPHCRTDVSIHALEPGDVYLLCTDGLTRMLRDDVILDHLRSSASLPSVSSRLIAAANDAGGRDNITVVLISVRREPSSLVPGDHDVSNSRP